MKRVAEIELPTHVQKAKATRLRKSLIRYSLLLWNMSMETWRRNGNSTILAFSFVSVATLIITLILSFQELTQTSLTGDNSTEASVRIEITPAYLLYPGQEVTLRWQAEGINVFYLNNEETSLNNEETLTVDHCTTLVWSGETTGGTSYNYNWQPSYIFQQSFLLAGFGSILIFFVLVKIDPQLSVAPQMALYKRLVNTVTRQDTALSILMIVIGSVALVLLLSVEDSCVANGKELLASYRNIFYLGIVIGSIILVIAGLIRPAVIRLHFLVREYTVVLMILFVMGYFQAWGYEEGLPNGWLLVVFVAYGSTLVYVPSHTSLTTLRHLLVIILIISIIGNSSKLFNDERFSMRPSNKLRDLHSESSQIDLYEYVRENYRDRRLWINLPSEYYEYFNSTIHNRLAIWGQVGGRRINQPELYLTQNERSELLAIVDREIWIPGLGFFMIPPSEGEIGPVLMSHFDDDKVFVIPFEYLSERIQEIWSINSSS